MCHKKKVFFLHGYFSFMAYTLVFLICQITKNNDIYSREFDCPKIHELIKCTLGMQRKLSLDKNNI